MAIPWATMGFGVCLNLGTAKVISTKVGGLHLILLLAMNLWSVNKVRKQEHSFYSEGLPPPTEKSQTYPYSAFHLMHGKENFEVFFFSSSPL